MLKSSIVKRERKSVGRPTYLSCDKEALIVSVEEMKGAHALPSTQKIIGDKLNSILENLGKRRTETNVKTKQAYAREVIHLMTRIEDEQVGQKKRSATGEIKFSGLSNKRATQSDPLLQWMMFHKMCTMYREINPLRTDMF